MMRKSFLAFAVGAALTVAVFAATSDSPKSSPITVGEFAMKVSKALGRVQADPKAAVESLKSLGARFNSDLQARVTEGQAARILTDLGVRVSTSTPAKALSLAKADQLISAVSFSSSAASVSPAQDFPTQCLELRTRGECVECCKPALGCGPADEDPVCVEVARLCSHSCQVIPPPGKPSPTEPEP